jgi:transcriptional regulator with XRE-family HTH domain
MNDFGRAVKHYLTEYDVKQKSISQNLGVTEGAISQLINAENISLDKMQMIAKGLNCDLEIILKPQTKN